MKKTFLLMLLSFVIGCACGQNGDTLATDTLYLPIPEYSYIQEGIYYPTYIKEIQKIENGYVVRCNVNVQGSLFPAWVVAGANDLKYNGKRLHKRSHCSLSFKKYHQISLGYSARPPKTWIGDYYEEILDVLQGIKIISVKETNHTKCFLVSLDLGRKEKHWNDSVAFCKEEAFEQIKDSLLPTLRDFLHRFSYFTKWEESAEFWDVSQMQHCFNQWSLSSKFLDLKQQNDKQEFSKQKFGWRRCDFAEKISDCQSAQHLPVIAEKIEDERIEISDLRLLYMSGDRITVRVSWTILQGEAHTLVLSLERKNEQWKITGVARKTWHNE